MPKATPSSLKWLIDRQVRLAGRLANAESKRAVLKIDITDLKRQLSLIEWAMTLHDIRIEPSDLRPIRPHQGRLLKGGKMSQIIMKTVADAPERKAATPEILDAVLRQLPYEPTLDEHLHIQARVQVRLCDLVNQGRLVRRNTGHRKTPRVWELPQANSDVA
jgi:hypothetical protein